MNNNEVYPILSRIRQPDDVRALGVDELEPLCREIRSCLVDTVCENGGHLASNLGVVELTLALYRCLRIGEDRIIWDVGHQAYVHKLLSGRLNEFDTLRKPGGVGGFPRRTESPYDVFGTGHGSTALSAALGFARADQLRGDSYWTVAVIGDGAYTGGMVHEALNNCDRNLHLMVILNENEMSISPNTGKFAGMLTKLRNSSYYKSKAGLKSFLARLPVVGRPLSGWLSKMKKNLKNRLYNSNYFENMGLYYLGPVDGNDYRAVETVLHEAMRQGVSCLIHIKTKKGKGYEPAEQAPGKYHSVPAQSASAAGDSDAKVNYSGVFGASLSELAAKDDRVCAVTAAMADGTGLSSFASAYPKRFFDVGMAEEHAVTFAAGLAASGYRPYVALYSTFLQRAFDQVIHDVALQSLPVTFCIDRAGLNGADGPTHHGIFDVSFFASLPNVRVLTPYAFSDLKNDLNEALRQNAPVAIRYPNGRENAETMQYFSDVTAHPVCVPLTVPQHLDAWIVVHGRMADTALAARKLLAEKGICAEVLLLTQLSPYAETVRVLAQTVCVDVPLFCVEEEIQCGGFGMQLANAAVGVMPNRFFSIGTENPFVNAQAGKTIWETAGVDAKSICDKIIDELS